MTTTLTQRNPRSAYLHTLWALTDQCVVSGGNFLTNLFLVRTLVPAEFGIYALLLNAVLFLNNLQSALINYPVCVRGTRESSHDLRRTAFVGLVATLVFFLFTGTSISAISIYLHRSDLIVVAALAMLFWQCQETLRSAFFSKLEQRRAIVGDAISYVGQASVVAFLCVKGSPPLSLIFTIIAATSLAGFAVQLQQLRPRRTAKSLRPDFEEFWKLGRWNLVAKVMGFLTLQSFPWLILARHGTEQVAGFQAMFQFLAFSNPVLFSVGTLITATVARRGRYEFLSIRPYLTLVVGTIGGYLLLLILAAPAAMDLVLGKHSVYLPYAPLLRVLAFAWVFEGIALLSSAILGGLRSSRSLFQIQLAGAVVAIVAILPWIYFQGVFAAAVGMLVVNLVRAAAGVILIARQKANPQRLDHQFAATSGPAYEPIATREDSTNLTPWASR